MTGFLFFLSVQTVWLLAVTALLIKLLSLFNKLTKGVEVKDLKQVLEKVISKEEENKKEIGALLKKINILEDDAFGHIQKVGLVRFNPFKELGGDHSFSLVILDSKDDGVVITSLHTRDRTRVYMKEIKDGKGESELSVDEKKALSVALKK